MVWKSVLTILMRLLNLWKTTTHWHHKIFINEPNNNYNFHIQQQSLKAIEK